MKHRSAEAQADLTVIRARAGLVRMRLVIERDWQPYLDGRVEFAGALRNLVRDAGE